VPCYNHERYVVACLESIARQDYPNLAVIVVDDASADQTARIAEEACRRHGFRFQRNEVNIGRTATMNKMCDLAGEFDYIINLASDDLLAPMAISSMVAAFSQDRTCVGTYGDASFIDAEGRDLGPMRNDKVSGDIFEAVLFGRACIPSTWIMWTSAAYRMLGRLDENTPLEDALIFAKLGRLGTIRYCGAEVVKYRKHPQNTTANAWTIYEASCKLLESFRGEYFYPTLRRLYGSENFFLLSRHHKREALRYLVDGLRRPFRKQFIAAILNLIGLTFVVDRFSRK
jgi:alpha-1,3-rhamnosyltransferase